MGNKINDKKWYMAFETRRLDHVRLRLQQRYGLEIDLAEMRALNRFIANGGGEKRTEENGAIGLWTFFKSKWVYWIYLVSERCVTTAYPIPPTSAPAFVPAPAPYPNLTDELDAAQAEIAQLRAALEQKTAENNLLNNQMLATRGKLATAEEKAATLFALKVAPTKAMENELSAARGQVGNMGTELKALNRKMEIHRKNWSAMRDAMRCFDNMMGKADNIQRYGETWARMRAIARSTGDAGLDMESFSPVYTKEAELFERWFKNPTEPEHAPEIW
jgi:hypothetical protein